MIGKCDKCGNSVEFFNIKQGLCTKCRENGSELVDNVNNFLSKQPFIFKNSQGAFEYACKYLDCTLRKDAMLPAIVISNASQKYGQSEEREKDFFLIKVASDDGGFEVLAETVNNTDIKLKQGDFVGWQAAGLISDLGKKLGDIRCGWVGFILTTLKLELTDRGWNGDKAL